MPIHSQRSNKNKTIEHMFERATRAHQSTFFPWPFGSLSCSLLACQREKINGLWGERENENCVWQGDFRLVEFVLLPDVLICSCCRRCYLPAHNSHSHSLCVCPCVCVFPFCFSLSLSPVLFSFDSVKSKINQTHKYISQVKLEKRTVIVCYCCRYVVHAQHIASFGSPVSSSLPFDPNSWHTTSQCSNDTPKIYFYSVSEDRSNREFHLKVWINQEKQ